MYGIARAEAEKERRPQQKWVTFIQTKRVTVGLTTRLSTERDQGVSIFIGRFVEAIRETLIKRDVLSIL